MNKSRMESLKCMNCEEEYPVQTQSRCRSCNGILTAKYSLKGLKYTHMGNDMWYFSEILPPISRENIVSLGEGSTPYVRAERYARKIDVKHLWFKLEYLNPTGSFKDRAASLGLSLAKEWGYNGVFTASSGNAAAAISAYAARANLKCLILLRDDATYQKISQIAMYAPFMIRVKSLFDSKENLEKALRAVQLTLPRWFNHFLWAPYNPLIVDAFKTISYEMVIEDRELPQYIFVPVAGGDLIYGLYKGFKEMYEANLINKMPSLVAVQGKGADPTVIAIEKGMTTVPEIERADTVAGALRVNFGAEHALVAVRGSGGFGVSVSDEEIIEAQADLASLEGIFCETSSAAAVAALKKARDTGRLDADESVAIVITGAGFKDFRLTLNENSIPIVHKLDEISHIINESIYNRPLP